MMKIMKIYFLGLTRINEGIYTSDNNRKLSLLVTPFIGLCLVGLIMFIYWNQMHNLMAMLREVGMVPQLLTLGVVAIMLICLFCSFFLSASIIFSSGDLSFWFSAPISKRQVFFGKSMIAYTFQITLSLLLIMPPLWLVGQYLNAGISFYILGILGVLVLPIPVFILGILLGILIHLLFKGMSSKKTLIITIIGTLGIVTLLVASFLVDEEIFSDFWRRAVEYISVSRWLQLGTQYFIDLMLDSSIVRIILYFGIHLLLLASFLLVASSFYHQQLSLFTPISLSKNMANATFKNQPPWITLYKKEFKRYLSSNVYMMNTGSFIVILIVASTFLAFNPDMAINSLLILEETLGITDMGMIPVVISIVLLVSLASTTASSISLEGKNFSKLKSFPVSVLTIFWSKICVNLTLAFTGLIVSLPIAFRIFPFTGIEMLLSIWMTIGYSVGSAVLGLIINLKLPKLDWDNESVPVKQSSSAIASLIGNIAIVVGPTILLIRIFDIQRTNLLLSLAIFVTVLSIVMLTLLYKFGAEWFRKINE